MNWSDIAEKILQGDRRALARAITLAESTRGDHRAQAEELLGQLMPHTGKAIRLGLSGAPGVGKSTFIEAFGMYLTGLGHKVAVLAIDPSSQRSGGSILGDKTRMEELSRNPNAFIRPSPSSGSLGGVARRTREAMLLVEAAGFNVVLVETVGVGQSEVAVSDMVDMFILLQSPGGGDELQGIKRGIMELADLIVVNKADGPLEQPAKQAASEYAVALRLMRPKADYWTARVLRTSALKNKGIDEVWQAVQDFHTAAEAAGGLADMRAGQARAWMWSEISDTLAGSFKAHPGVSKAIPGAEKAVMAGTESPGAAARRLLALFLGGRD